MQREGSAPQRRCEGGSEQVLEQASENHEGISAVVDRVVQNEVIRPKLGPRLVG